MGYIVGFIGFTLLLYNRKHSLEIFVDRTDDCCVQEKKNDIISLNKTLAELFHPKLDYSPVTAWHEVCSFLLRYSNQHEPLLYLLKKRNMKPIPMRTRSVIIPSEVPHFSIWMWYFVEEWWKVGVLVRYKMVYSDWKKNPKTNQTKKRTLRRLLEISCCLNVY